VWHIQLEGTWQVLVRSTFRQTSTLPSTVKFVPEQDGTVRLIRVRSTKYKLFFFCFLLLNYYYFLIITIF